MLNKKEVYLDNAGSTMVSEEALEEVIKYSREIIANPSAIHKAGMVADDATLDAKKEIAKVLNSESSEIYFTSGGTESNNIAVLGSVRANKRNGNHIITTKIEHASVKNTMKSLEDSGYEITYLNVDKEGYIDLKELENSITDQTILVSIIHVNNETGTIQHINEIGNIIKKKNSKTLFHVDGVQGFSKYNVNVKKDKIDLYSISGHKIHSIKGTGALYIKDKTNIKNIMFGGSQQGGYRPGTENVPGIMALGMATKIMRENHDEIISHMTDIKRKLFDRLTNEISDIKINGPSLEESAAHILNISIKGIKAQILINALSEDEIYVSAGSACSSKNKGNSDTLTALGIEKSELEGSIRISFSKYSKLEDIDYIAENMKKHITAIRKVSGYKEA